MLDDEGYILVKGQKKIDKTSLASRLKLREVEFFTDEELAQVPSGEVFFFDVECYWNFFYIAFKHAGTGKYVAFELSPDFTINIEKLNWMLWRFCLVGFNSRGYDIPMISLALTGANCEELKRASSNALVISSSLGKARRKQPHGPLKNATRFRSKTTTT
jgi:hypothetical protein